MNCPPGGRNPLVRLGGLIREVAAAGRRLAGPGHDAEGAGDRGVAKANAADEGAMGGAADTVGRNSGMDGVTVGRAQIYRQA